MARAYGLAVDRIKGQDEIVSKVKKALETPGPVICDVWLDDLSRITPKTNFGNPIEDQWPFLADDEFYGNMLIPPLDRKK